MQLFAQATERIVGLGMMDSGVPGVSLAEIARLSGGDPLGARIAEIAKIRIDSRQCEEGDLFVALKGEREDGHSYVPDALEMGCAGALVEREFWLSRGEELVNRFPDSGFVVVGDSTAGLQRCAANYRNEYLGEATRVGITGSNGKSTVKEMIGGILSNHRPTWVSPGNLNSDVGVPLSILEAPTGVEYVVQEMGVNRVGEMEELVEMFAPDIGIITNIGTAHAGPLGGREGIAREKRVLFQGLGSSGCAFLWEDEPWFDYLVEALPGKVFGYGEKSDFFGGAEADGLNGWIVRLGGRRISLPLIGGHNVINAIGATAVALWLGVSWDSIEAGLSSQIPLFGRGEVIRGEITIVVDCYNANAESFRSGIDSLSALPWDGRKVLVAGEMGELGELSDEIHDEMRSYLLDQDCDALFLLGFDSGGAEFYSAGGNRWSFPGGDYPRLEEAVLGYVRPGDLVYLKGSRACRLERLVETLKVEYA